jgi:hypothetical protein
MQLKSLNDLYLYICTRFDRFGGDPVRYGTVRIYGFSISNTYVCSDIPTEKLKRPSVFKWQFLCASQ